MAKRTLYDVLKMQPRPERQVLQAAILGFMLLPRSQRAEELKKIEADPSLWANESMPSLFAYLKEIHNLSEAARIHFAMIKQGEMLAGRRP